jgi:hypothetical protein
MAQKSNSRVLNFDSQSSRRCADSNPWPAHCSCANVATAKSRARTTNVTNVLALANFYCDSRGFEPPIHALRRGTKLGTVKSWAEDLTGFWCATRIRISAPSICNRRCKSVCGRARSAGLSWPLPAELGDEERNACLNPRGLDNTTLSRSRRSFL